MHLTPDILEATYDYLRQTPPFSRWKMPPGDEVEFFVTQDEVVAGLSNVWYGRKERIRLSISNALVAHTTTLVTIMAHEMVHAYVDSNPKLREKSHHGRNFKRCAALVCKHHGFDPKMF